MARKHWTEPPTPCICGARFRSAIAEARHRHNFPILCNKKGLAKWQAENCTPIAK